MQNPSFLLQKSIFCNAKSIMFNERFIICNAKFIMFNEKIICWGHDNLHCSPLPFHPVKFMDEKPGGRIAIKSSKSGVKWSRIGQNRGEIAGKSLTGPRTLGSSVPQRSSRIGLSCEASGSC